MAIDLGPVLSDAGATAPIKDRVETILELFNAATAVDADEVIISEYVVKKENEEQRVYESLFIFSGAQLYEAKNFLKAVKLDCINMTEFGYWELTAVEFGGLENADETSRLTLELRSITDFSFSAIIQASGLNCNRLGRIFKDRIRPVVGT